MARLPQWMLVSLAVLLLGGLLGSPAAQAAPVDPSNRAAEQAARSAWTLILQRQRRSGDDPDALLLRGSRFQEAPPTDTDGGSLLPLSFGLGSNAQFHFTYGLAGPSQKDRDPVAAELQGFGFTAGAGGVKSDSLLYFYRPKLDGGAAATMVQHFHAADATRATDAARLRSGQAFVQNLEFSRGETKITGRLQDIDAGFAPVQRLVSGGNADEMKRLQELMQQRGTQRTALGLTTGLAKGWSFNTGVDTIGDGEGRIHSEQFGITGTFLRFNASRQNVDAGFKGFKRFVDPEVQKLEAFRGVQRSSYQWGLTPSKWMGFEGGRTVSRDAGGSLDTQTLGVKLGALQYSNRVRSVAGFKSFGSLAAPDQTLQKIAGVTLRETQLGLGLGGKTRLGFSDTRIADAGGESSDRLFSLDSRTMQARARFRSIGSGFKSFAGLAQFDKQFAGLDQHRNRREELYDLDYTGSSRFALRNHFEHVTGAQAKDGWGRTQWANGLDVNLGATTMQAFRSQTQSDNAKVGASFERLERLNLRRTLKGGNFIAAQRSLTTSQDADGERTITQNDLYQTKLQVARFFAMDGQRSERRASGEGLALQDTLNLSRKLGAFTAGWSFRNRDDAQGREEAQKLTLAATLWRGAAFTSTREHRLAQAGEAATTVVSDQRYTLTQQVAKKAKLSYAFAHIETDGRMSAGEQVLKAETQPFGTMLVAADFAQRQAAGKAVGVIQGFSLVDEKKERRWGWRANYRHRSRTLGPCPDTKGWAASYRGGGKVPFTLTGSFARNPEDAKGEAKPASVAAADLNTGLGARLVLALGYKHSADDTARKAEERFQFSLGGKLGLDETLKLTAATQRNFDPTGRTRAESIGFEYGHGADDELFSFGGDINFRTMDAKLHVYKTEYRAEVKWTHGF